MKRVAQGAATRLRRARAAWERRRLLEALARWAGLTLPGLALLFLLGFLLPPTPFWSALAAGAAALWLIVATALWLVRPLLHRPSLVSYALWLERRAPLRRNELVNALLLEREQARWARDPISRDLVEVCLRRAGERLAALPLGRLHRQLHLGRAIWPAAAGLFIFAAAIGLAPMRAADSARLFLSVGGAEVVPAIAIAVTPGDARLERGGAVTVRAEITGRRRPRGAELEMRPPGADWVRARMTAERETADSLTARVESDRYAFLLGALSGDLEYRVRTGWGDSPTFRLRVVERLQAVGYRKNYHPPDYTGLAAQREVAGTGELAAIAGTRVELEVMHRRRGAEGRLHFAGGPAPRSLDPVAADRLGAAWQLDETGAYWVELIDAAEQERWVSDTFHVEVVPDLAPAVRLLSPPEVIPIPPDLRVTLEIDCVDDFGLTELALVYGRAQDDPVRERLAAWTDRKEARVTYNWDLSTVTVLPGQELHYYLQVLDNDALRGPKRGETPLCTIRFPSLAEMYAQEETEREEDIADLQEALQGQETLREELSKVAQEMLKEKEISWERQQEIQDLISRQEALAEKVAELHQSLEASQQRMENQNLFSMEMLDQIREIRDLVDEIQSEEFHALIDRMHQALEDLDRNALQQAMREMKLTQEEISQSLDRTLQMLRRLLAEEKLDRILQKIAELEARQAEVNRQLEMGESPESAAHTPTDEEPLAEGAASDSTAQEEGRPLTPEEAEELRAQQEEIRRELEALREALAELRDSSGKGLEDLKLALEEFRKDPSLKETLEQMRQAQESMEQGTRSQALKFGRKARQGLQAMQASMTSMKQQLSMEEAEALARALYNIAHRLVRASVLQEELARNPDERGPRELAVREQELYEEIEAVSDSLLAVARKSPIITRDHLRSLGDVLRDIERARNEYERGSRRPATSVADESSRKLNAATKALLEAASRAQGMCGSNCPNPFNQMQSLSCQQNALNQDTQQMMAACQTPRLSLGQQEAMMRLAARQEMIRQGLQQIQGDLESSGKLLGDLGRIVDEMEEVTRELRTRQTDRRIIERQEQILSRMLSAQRSIRKRDESEERRSRTATDPLLRTSPPGVDAGRSPAERLRRAMLRGSKDPVPAEYRRLVETYLQLLMHSR